MDYLDKNIRDAVDRVYKTERPGAFFARDENLTENLIEKLRGRLVRAIAETTDDGGVCALSAFGMSAVDASAALTHAIEAGITLPRVRARCLRGETFSDAVIGELNDAGVLATVRKKFSGGARGDVSAWILWAVLMLLLLIAVAVGFWCGGDGGGRDIFGSAEVPLLRDYLV